MGFWSTLGKIAIPAASLAAIPFTGGASAMGLGAAAGTGSKILGALGTAGKVAGAVAPALSGAAKGSADQRLAETPGQIGTYNANVNATQAQDKRAALASLLGGGLQDAHVNRPAGSTIPNFSVSGGLRPSAMNQQALLEQLSKPIDPLTMPQAGTAEKVLGGVGLGTSILGALGGALGNIQRPSASSYQSSQTMAQNPANMPPAPTWLPRSPALMPPEQMAGLQNPNVFSQVRF